jgi:undecaprenyl diphosphate synthase
MSGSLQVPDKGQRPGHVAIIMDGNGRWAQERGLSRLEGHRKGADVVREITTFARELGVSYLTLYSFSRQNWVRPADEVAGLMALLEDYCRRERDTLMKNEIRLTTIGEPGRIPDPTRRALDGLIEETADNRMMTLCLAVDYGGREEVVSAVKRLVTDVRHKKLPVDAIDESAIEARLDTALMPDPDLLIRTSGELRLSNFLLWQLAYAELHFTSVRWPDFTRADFAAALRDYSGRERRFGHTGDQLVAPGGVPAEFELGDMPASVRRFDKDNGPC